MKTKRVALLLLLAAVGCRTAPTESLDEERAQIRLAIEERERQFDEAIRTKDAELLVRVFSDDARLLTQDQPILRKEDLIEYWASYLALNPRLEATVEYLDVGSALDIAYEVGTYVEEYDTPTGRVRGSAKYLNVWRKMGGAWRLVAEADVYDTTEPELIYPIDAAARRDTLMQRAADSLATLPLRRAEWPPRDRDSTGGAVRTPQR